MSRPKQEKSCRTCRSCVVAELFSTEVGRVTTSKDAGICRRYPPVLVGPNQSSFPAVKLDAWVCDEWRKA